MEDSKCPANHNTREHEFVNIGDYARDDHGFILRCVNCDKDVRFEVDTFEDLLEIFGL